MSRNYVLNTGNGVSLFVGSNQNVGFHTAAPSEKLHFDKGHAKFNSNIYVMKKIGISTSNPSVELDVTGDAHVTGDISIEGDMQIYNPIMVNGFYVTKNTAMSNNILKTAISSAVHNMDVNEAGTKFAIANRSQEFRFIATSNETNIFKIDGLGNLTVYGDVLPDVNVAYDLGSSNKRFKDLYLSGNTINMDNVTISKDITTGNIKLQDATTGSMKSLMVSELQLVDNDKIFKIKHDSNIGKVKFVTMDNSNNELDEPPIPNLFTYNSNIGIGISNPITRLHVSDDAIINTSKIGSYLGDKSYAMFAHSNSATTTGYALLHHSSGDTYINAASSKTIRFRINNNDAIAINSAGRLGIGLSNPQVSLEINSTDSIKVPVGTTGQRPAAPQQGYIRYNTSINTFEGYGAGNTWGSLGGIKDTNQDTYITAESFPTSNDDIIRFFNSNNETLRITANGRIGISNQSPSERLEVSGGNAKFSSNIYVLSRMGIANSNPTESLDITGNLKASSNMYVIRRQAIGTSNPTESLDIIGNLKTSSNMYSMSRIGVANSNPTESLDIIGNLKTSSNMYSMSRIGVATSNPTESLDIIGNLKTSSNMYSMSRIGVATSNPTESLDIIGNLKTSSNMYSMSRIGVATSNPTESLDIIGNLKTSSNMYSMSRIGVATSNPTESLDIIGNLKTSSNMYSMSRIGVATSNPTESLDIIGNLKTSSNMYSMSRIGVATSNPTESLDIIGNTKVSNSLFVLNNIGIGLSNPLTTLEVNGGIKVRSNVEILGDLTIRGTTTTVDSTTVNIVDNIIRLNNGAAFSSALQAGFEVNRGAGYSNYLVVFDEASDTLQTGFQGSLKEVPNIDSSLISNGVLLYDNTNKKITSCNNFIYSGIGLGIGTTTPTEQLDINKNIKVNSNLYVLSRLGIATSNPSTSVEINATDAILLPKGTTAQRPSFPSQGQVRYNTSINTFEGYGAGNTWGSLGGIKDTNQDTYISAESFPTSNDDILRFFNSNNETLRITATGRIGISNQSPSERLEVSGGNAKFSSNIYVLSRMGIANSNPSEALDIIGNLKASSNMYVIRRQAIGTSNPTESLDIIGNLKTSSNMYSMSRIGVATSNPTESLDIIGNLKTSSNIYSINRIGIANSNPTESLDIIGNLKTSSNMYAMSRIGLGTSNPTYQLHASGTIAPSNTVYLSDGTSLLPTIAWSNDLDTGIYHLSNHSIGISTGGVNALTINNNKVGINTLNPEFALDVMDTVHVSSNILFGGKTFISSNILFPSSALAVNNPSGSLNGINYTFVSTNLAGNWDGGWWYDFDYNTNLTCDPYTAGIFNGATATSNVDGSNVIRGQMSGITGSSNFILKGYRFENSNASITNLPKKLYLLGSYDNTNWNTIDYYLVNSNVYSTPLGTNITGLDRQVENTSNYRYYRVVFNELLSGNGFTIQEFRWYISSINALYKNGIYYNTSNNMYGINTPLPKYTLDVNGDIASSNMYLSSTGTATTPGYSWTEDSNTGMYRVGEDSIGFSTDGVNRVTINSTGISGNGSGLTSLSADNISSGTLPVARGGTGTNTSTGGGAVVLANDSVLTGNTTAYNLQVDRTLQLISWNFNNDCKINFYSPNTGSNVNAEIWYEDYNNNVGSGFRFRSATRNAVGAPANIWFQHDGRIHCQYLTSYGNIIANGGNLESYSSNVSSVNPIFNAAKRTDGVVHNTITLGTTYGPNATANLRFADNRHLTSDKLSYSSNHLGIGFWNNDDILNVHASRRIGINTTRPTEFLDITGNLKASSNIYSMSCIGISTSNPTEALDIIGNTKISSNLYVINNIGIGLSNPSITLEVNGGVKVRSNVEILGDLTIRGTTTTVDSTTVNITDNIIRLNNGAVFNASLQSGIEINRGTGNSNYYLVYDEISDVLRAGFTGTLSAVATRDDSPPSFSIPYYNFATSNYTAINQFVYSNNNLGIGVTNPIYKLDTNGAIRSTLNNGAGMILESIGHIDISFSNNQSAMAQIGLAYGNTQYSSHASSNDLVIRNMKGKVILQNGSSTSALVINSNNFVGIGTNAPAVRLDVVGTTNSSTGYSSGSATLEANDAQNGNWKITGNAQGSYDGIRFTTADISILAGNAGIKRSGFYNNGVGWALYIDENRNMFCPGDITGFWSDKRLKSNLEEIKDHDHILSSLTGYRFNWNEKGQEILQRSEDDIEVGLIAQDVQSVLPQAVKVNKAGISVDSNEDEQNDYLTINYDKLVPILIEGYKDQKSRIAKLEEEITYLKEKIK